ncbi:MAG: hypothetical protein IAE79_17355 [Anaerolinea sp.]|nr:hypothetical protein [Anaerolinea sp.]
MSEPNDEGSGGIYANSKSHSVAKGDCSFLLQPEPEAMLVVELVDSPVQLSRKQFEALLIDSECEV